MNPDDLTELLSAVRSKDLKRLREHLKDPEKVMVRTPHGRTLLHAAAEEGNTEAVTLLLDAGIPVDARDNNEETPLHFAVRCGAGRGTRLTDPEFNADNPWERWQKEYYSPEHMRTLLHIINRRDPRIPAGLTSLDDITDEIDEYSGPAFDALDADPQLMIREFAAEGVDLITAFPETGERLLGFPRYRQTIGLFLDRGANVNALDDEGLSVLHKAIENGDVLMVELLLKRGADPTVTGPRKYGGESGNPMSTALGYQASTTTIPRLLMASGAQLNSNHLPLHGQAQNGKVEILQWLIEKGGDVNEQYEDGNTVLMIAAYDGQENAVAVLCRHGCDILLKNKVGQTALHMAAYWHDCLEPVLALHPPVNAQCHAGLTPLHHAAQAHDSLAIKMLLSAGADIRMQDKEGNASLHMIFLGDWFLKDRGVQVINALLEGGADKTIKNNHGMTAFDLGVERNFPEQYLDLLRP